MSLDLVGKYMCHSMHAPSMSILNREGLPRLRTEPCQRVR